MKNNYVEFLELVGRIGNKRVRKNCEELPKVAQEYYSYLKWYEQLKYVNGKLKTVNKKKKDSNNSINKDYEKNNRKIKVSLFDNYVMLMCYEYVSASLKHDGENRKYTFTHFLNEFVFYKEWKDKSGNYFIFKEYPELNNIKYRKYIEQAIKKYRIVKNAKSFDNNYADKRHQSLEDAINVFLEHKKRTIYDEETAFNNIFSDKLIGDMEFWIKGEENLIDIYIAPIRRTLSGNDGKGNKHNEYFCENIDRSYFELVELCNTIVAKYDKTVKNIVIMNKWFNRLENSIE